jgi:multidrug efflux pump subunit AcrB
MVLIFLRDLRSAVIVILNIPIAIAAALLALWIGGYTINLMTLGGLALAVGILVDEATVEIENIHRRMKLGGRSQPARIVLDASEETIGPRSLSMLCILAVFVPSFFMTGAAKALFLPLSLAVGFAMISSYLLSSTIVPILSIWWHKRAETAGRAQARQRVRAALALPPLSSHTPHPRPRLSRRRHLRHQHHRSLHRHGDLPANRRRPAPAPPSRPHRHATRNHRADRHTHARHHR